MLINILFLYNIDIKLSEIMKYLSDKDLWYLAEDIPDIDFFFSQIWLSCFVNEFAEPGGKAYKKILAIYRGYHLWFYYDEEDSNKVGEFLANKFISDPNFINTANKKIIETADKLRNFCQKLPESNLNQLSNEKLLEYYLKHDEIHTEYYQWGWLPVAADMFHSNFTEKLKDHLKKIGVPEDKVNESLVVLTQPEEKSLIQIEQEDFLQLASIISRSEEQKELFKQLYVNFKEKDVGKFGFKTHGPEYERLFEQKVEKIKDKIKPEIYQEIQRHYEKYFYVPHMWVGQAATFEYYLKELARLIGQNEDLAAVHEYEINKFNQAAKDRNNLLKKLNITGDWLMIFNGYADFMITKIYRRYSQIFAVYKMEFILSEIASRLQLSLKEVRFMLPQEINNALTKNQLDKKEIIERTRYCVYYAEQGKDKIYIGEEAKNLSNKTQKKVDKVKVIKGQTGCVGKAQGKVKIIIRPEDMNKMKKGDILVSIATDPDIVPAMKKAAAIVTEQGGVTSHAAIVSRELNIPCVIGTKIATKAFKDGDVVEVDANQGIVKKID